MVLDALTAEDIAAYDAMLDSLDHRELVCGFLSGKDELLHWEPSELFQFCRDTKPLDGDTYMFKEALRTIYRVVQNAYQANIALHRWF